MSKENIRVLLRLRPDESDDKSCLKLRDESTIDILPGTGNSSDAESVLNASKGRPKQFQFDKVFGPHAQQKEVYQAVDPLVKSAVEGYNATIFAYGSTGSGKTHTISGSVPDDSDTAGIIPRAVHRIFDLAQKLAENDSETLVLIHMGYVELYNNQFRDLLQQNNPVESKIELHSTPCGNVFLSGSPSLRTTVTSAQQAMRLIQIGSKNRMTSETDCNEHSSRSHAILTFHIESRSSATVFNLGKLHLVDLAGSERLSLSGVRDGNTLTETQNINLSLSTLGDVLSALSKLHSANTASSRKNRDSTLIPYRNSKLTYLLKDSLGGNSKTIMIANIRSPFRYRQQTLMTLMYATRAKKIQNRIRINVDTSGDSKASALATEVAHLKAQLRKREADFELLSRQIPGDLEEPFLNKERMEKLAVLSKENEFEKKRLEICLEQVVHNHTSTLAVQQRKYNDLQDKLVQYKSVFDKQRVEIKTLRDSLRELSHGATAEELHEMKKMVEKLAFALNEARQESQTKSTRLEESAKKNTLLKQELASLTAKNTETMAVQENLNVVQKKYAELKRASIEALEKLEEAQNNDKALKEKLAKMQIALSNKSCNECTEIKTKYDKAIASLQEQVASLLKAKEQVIHDLEKEKNTMANTASASQQIAGDMQKQRDEALLQVKTLQKQLGVVNVRTSQDEMRLQELKSEHMETKASLEAALEREKAVRASETKSLKVVLDEHLQRNANLVRENAKLMKQEREQLDMLKSVQTTKQTLEEQLVAKSKKVSSLQATIKKCEDEIIQATKAKAQTEEKMEKHYQRVIFDTKMEGEKIVKDVQQELTNVTKGNVSMRNQVAQLQATIKASEIEHAKKLNNTIRDAKSAEGKLLARLGELEAQVEQLTSDGQGTIERYQLLLSELQGKLKASETTGERGKQQIFELREQICGLEEELAREKAGNENFLKEFARIKQQLEAVEKERSMLSANGKRDLENQKLLENENQELKSRIVIAEQELSRQKSTLANCKLEYEDQIASLSRDATTTLETNAKLESTLSELQGKLQGVNKEKTQLENKFNELGDVHGKEINERTAHFEALQADFLEESKRLEISMAEQQDIITNLSKELHESKHSNKTISSGLTTAQDRITTLESDLKMAKENSARSVGTLENELRDSMATQSVLRKHIEELQQTKGELEKQAISLNDTKENVAIEYEAKLHTVTRQHHAELGAVRAEIQEYLKAKDELQAHFDMTKQQLAELRVAYNNMKCERDNKVAEFESMIPEINSKHTEEIANLRESLSHDKQSALEALKDELGGRDKTLCEALEELARLKQLVVDTAHSHESTLEAYAGQMMQGEDLLQQLQGRISLLEIAYNGELEHTRETWQIRNGLLQDSLDRLQRELEVQKSNTDVESLSKQQLSVRVSSLSETLEEIGSLLSVKNDPESIKSFIRESLLPGCSQREEDYNNTRMQLVEAIQHLEQTMQSNLAKEKIIKDLTAQLEAKDDTVRLESLRIENVNLLDTNVSLERRYISQVERVTEMELQLEKLQLTIARRDEENAGLKDRLTSVNAKLAVQAEWVNDLKMQRAALEAHIEAESAEANALRTTVVEMNDLERTIRVKESENRDLKLCVSSLEKEVTKKSLCISFERANTARAKDALARGVQGIYKEMDMFIQKVHVDAALPARETQLLTLQKNVLKIQTAIKLDSKKNKKRLLKVNQAHRRIVKDRMRAVSEEKRAALKLVSDLHKKEIASKLTFVCESQKRLLEATQKENVGGLANSSMVNGEQAPGKNQGNIPSNQEKFTNPGGEYKLRVLNSSLRGDASTLKNILSVGFMREDFATPDESFLPLHRAISGFHFHGDTRKVLDVLQVLVTNHAPINSQDRTGNTVLHKALQVIPSVHILQVVEKLLELGSDVSILNRLGDTPLHTELRRIRSPSLDIIKLFVNSGASLHTTSNVSCSPLELVKGIISDTKPATTSISYQILEYLSSLGK